MFLLFADVFSYAEESLRAGANRLDCVRASELCLKEQACSTKYRTMRQCVAGGKESNFSMLAGLEAKDECRSAMDALKQSPLYHCRCKRGMKKEKNCLRIYWGIYQTLQGCFSFLLHSFGFFFFAFLLYRSSSFSSYLTPDEVFINAVPPPLIPILRKYWSVKFLFRAAVILMSGRWQWGVGGLPVHPSRCQ